MIKIIKGMPVGTIGLEAEGKVTEDDYRDVLLPAVSAAVERNDVRLLYILGERLRVILTRRYVGRHQVVGATPQGVEEDRHRLRRRLAGAQRQGLRLAHTG
jgi:hypothetical protein